MPFRDKLTCIISGRPSTKGLHNRRRVRNFYRAMLRIRGTSHGLCLSVCPSVRHKSVFYQKTDERIEPGFGM